MSENHQAQQLEDLCVSCDSIDLVGSVALNARHAVRQGPCSTSHVPSGHTVLNAKLPEHLENLGDAEFLIPQTQENLLRDESINGEEKHAIDTSTVNTNTSGTGSMSSPVISSSADERVVPESQSASAVPMFGLASLQHVLQKNSNNLALVSDVDEQLLLKIAFKQPVRLSSFSILASTNPPGFVVDADEENSVSGPKFVKVYCNKSTLDFGGIADEAFALAVVLSRDDILQQRRIPLPGSKFQMCTSVHFFIQENQSGAVYTFLNKLSLYGAVHKRYS